MVRGSLRPHLTMRVCDLPLRGLLLALGGDVGGLGERTRVIGAEQFCAELHRRIELRLAEAALGRRRGAQPVEQQLRAGIEIVLQIGVDAPRRLADREFARIVAAGCGERELALDLLDLEGIDDEVRRGPPWRRAGAAGGAPVRADRRSRPATARETSVRNAASWRAQAELPDRSISVRSVRAAS